MIEASLAAFINSQDEFSAPGLALKAYSKTPDVALGEIPAPFCLVSPMTEGAQELWVVGDTQRKENPITHVCFYAVNDEQRRQYETRFRRLIESAKANDDGDLLHPGIDFTAFADLLRDSGDHQTYFSDQPNWSVTPTPVVYKNEDSNGEPVVVSSGFTVDTALGKVVFSSANLSTDLIRATYKFGVIDFNIIAVDKFETSQTVDVANNPQRYAVVFALECHYYIKSTVNRYL